MHENARYRYKRVGIGSEDELAALIDAWRELTTPVAAVKPRPVFTTGDFISVPFYVEGNGSKTFFAPALRHPKGYQVGKKGDEQYIADYWEALAFLKGMASPAFRRPNGNGNRGIVTCQPGDTEDVSLRYLQEQLAQTNAAGGHRADNFVRVPFYREDSGKKTFFLPDCRLSGGYEIGARGRDKERGIESYWTALDKLLGMEQPRFRRRNERGNSGTVTCKPGDVEEVSRSFIEQERAKYGG
ncbi:hypothetical protein BG58_37260 [Caballeronia jiangsuensis]|nr:hypothetical protein BG58_37260 [Caballeronia jiangsuensis]